MSMHILLTMCWSSVDAARPLCLCVSFQISRGRLCMELDFIVSRVTCVGRLCTELDNMNTERTHHVLVVCGCSSAFLFMFSNIVRSSPYGARP